MVLFHRLSPTNWLIIGITCGSLVCAPMARRAFAEDDEKVGKQGKHQVTDGSESTKHKSMDGRYSHDECPALGVVVGPCPGEAICVTDTVWGSPADEAGIRSGDYILYADGEKITSPTDLRDLLEKATEKKRMTLIVWRDGREFTRQVDLAKGADDLPASHKAWLGVRLFAGDESGDEAGDETGDEKKGLLVDRVIRNSPADEAGLTEGDRIVRVNDKGVTNVESFINCVTDAGPGSELKITVFRDDAEETLTATLDSVEKAPLAYLREAFRDAANPSPRGSSADESSSDLLDATIEEMRAQINDLQQQLNQMTGETGAETRRRLPRATTSDGSHPERVPRLKRKLDQGQSGDKESKENRDQAQPAQDANSDDSTDDSAKLLPSAAAQETTLVVQRGRDSDRGDDRRRQYDRSRRHYQGNPYSDWRGRYPYNYNRYSPLYRSPGFGNSYYRYGGNPYYHGRQYWYGPRSGIRLGPNLGIYWY